MRIVYKVLYDPLKHSFGGLKSFLTKNQIDIKQLVSYTLFVGNWVGILTDIGSYRSQYANHLNPGGTENEHETNRKHARG
jgi:hypothetical protein